MLQITYDQFIHKYTPQKKNQLIGNGSKRIFNDLLHLLRSSLDLIILSSVCYGIGKQTVVLLVLKYLGYDDVTILDDYEWNNFDWNDYNDRRSSITDFFDNKNTNVPRRALILRLYTTSMTSTFLETFQKNKIIPVIIITSSTISLKYSRIIKCDDPYYHVLPYELTHYMRDIVYDFGKLISYNDALKFVKIHVRRDFRYLLNVSFFLINSKCNNSFVSCINDTSNIINVEHVIELIRSKEIINSNKITLCKTYYYQLYHLIFENHLSSFSLDECYLLDDLYSFVDLLPSNDDKYQFIDEQIIHPLMKTPSFSNWNKLRNDHMTINNAKIYNTKIRNNGNISKKKKNNKIIFVDSIK